MKNFKKYTDVIRYGKDSTLNIFNTNDHITITEKIDGANTSFILDNENESGVSCYSRRQPLDKINNLSGYFEWVNKNIVPIKERLKENYRYFGEFTLKHKVKYKDTVEKSFYLFSIWDDKKEEYLPDDIVKSEAKRLNFNLIPYFYDGPFISIEHIESFVGKSDLTEVLDTGEGIVVKNQDYKDPYGVQVFVKIVSKRFLEVKYVKLKKEAPDKVIISNLATSVVTKARIEKLLYKLKEDGKLLGNFTIKDIGIVLKALASSVIDDVMKEESEIFKDFDIKLINKAISSKVPPIIKEILSEGEILTN